MALFDIHGLSPQAERSKERFVKTERFPGPASHSRWQQRVARNEGALTKLRVKRPPKPLARVTGDSNAHFHKFCG